MTAHIDTVAFAGIEALPVDVQVQVAKGLPSFTIVGLPDKAVAESRERIRAAFEAMGLSFPARRVTVNLSPADLRKEGSHYDLPVALGLLVAMDVIGQERFTEFLALGELSLDGRVMPVPGVLPAALTALARDQGIICPAAQGGEAAWAGPLTVLAPVHLLSLLNHFRELQTLPAPAPRLADTPSVAADLADLKGQHVARRALEIAAAGGHHIVLSGPPGVGKSMLAQRLPGLLPPLQAKEALEVSMIASVSGALREGRLLRQRPYRTPHHSSSMAALVGGGPRAAPGEISLAHHGVLFLDELPEFSRQALDALRQPLESQAVSIARANAHITYPAKIQLVAAMNPCRCGYLADAERACNRAPRCAVSYQSRVSGPLYDRCDLFVEVPELSAAELVNRSRSESTADVAARVAVARQRQLERYRDDVGNTGAPPTPSVQTNAACDGELLQKITETDSAGTQLLQDAIARFRLSGRGYHRILRVARTIADLAGAPRVGRIHIAEALSYRRLPLPHRPG